MTELNQTRQEINRINQQLVKLLEQRFTAVTKVNNYKVAHQLPILDQQREQHILNKVTAETSDPAKAPLIAAIFQDIMKQSRQYEQALRKED